MLQIYEDGLNVSDLAVVEAAGRELGLEGVSEYLRSDEGKREVLQVREAFRPLLQKLHLLIHP
jgi:hypothetical protein